MDDWRLRGQEKYMSGAELFWRKYTLYREGWDHDHCAFCWKKFSLRNGDCHEGYATKDEYHWVCKECYEDFKSMFNWKIISN